MQDKIELEVETRVNSEGKEIKIFRRKHLTNDYIDFAFMFNLWEGLYG